LNYPISLHICTIPVPTSVNFVSEATNILLRAYVCINKKASVYIEPYMKFGYNTPPLLQKASSLM